MKTGLLALVNTPEDLRTLDPEQLPDLAKELRQFIIDIVASKEGHLGASLGVVELSIALHYSFNTPRDLLIWDVGHQAYGHKILTDRKDLFHTNRQLNGLSGFPKRSESIYDAFGVGHSSTSISAILGMAIASKIKGENKEHIAVIGDASIASGMAFEGMNHAGVTNANILIILNDNAIGIDPSVGALKNYLTNVKNGAVHQDNIFEALNFNYSGPVDGHNIDALLREFKRLKTIGGPRLLHIVTTKGKGLKPAELDQVTYHAPGKFDALTGKLNRPSVPSTLPKFQDVFGKTLLELAKTNEKIVGITPAMPTGSSLKLMMDEIPERAFDVGIAEQHAVTLAAGMAAEGLIVYCNIYSTFLQRAYDQVIHDVALQKLPVIFCLDRAGLVGQDGSTHHGVFDIAYLRCIPNLTIATPANAIELRQLLYTVQLGIKQPIAIRYPRGRDTIEAWQVPFEAMEIGKSARIKEGSQIAVLSFGTIAKNVSKAITSLSEAALIAHYNMRFISPMDAAALHNICRKYRAIITVEDGVISGGAGTAVLEFLNTNNYSLPCKILGIPDRFIEHGSIEELQKTVGLDPNSLAIEIKTLLNFVHSR